jgi:hypothetical protein
VFTWQNSDVYAYGSMASTIGAINPIRYRSYYYDAETGFYYLQTRYYGIKVYLIKKVSELTHLPFSIYLMNVKCFYFGHILLFLS